MVFVALPQERPDPDLFPDFDPNDRYSATDNYDVEHAPFVAAKKTLLRLEHLILSHQRLPEWGSPKPPMTPEARMPRELAGVTARPRSLPPRAACRRSVPYFR